MRRRVKGDAAVFRTGWSKVRPKQQPLPPRLRCVVCGRGIQRLTGVVTNSILGRYVPIVTTPNRLRICGSRCSTTSSAVIASYPSSRELYRSIPPSHSSVDKGSQRG